MVDLTHFDSRGDARMVDVSAKAETVREAMASGLVRMAPATLDRIQSAAMAKGDVFAVARLAGIMAAKRTGDLIPLCHPIGLDGVDLAITVAGPSSVRIAATTRTVGRTGVEMEALTAVSIAALTIYDMCKAIDRGIVIDRICLERKTGGHSGDFRRDEPENGPEVPEAGGE